MPNDGSPTPSNQRSRKLGRRKEIIVVDDGSTDQTVSIARQFASKDVAVISKANQGAAAARNHALSLSQGDYLQWLDADDLLSPDKIAKQIEVASQCQDTRTLLSSGWGFFAHRPDHAKFVPTPLWCDLSPVEWLLRKLSQNLHMQTATWLVSRDLTDAAGPWDTRLLSDDDGEYFCRVILASNGTRFVAPVQSILSCDPGEPAKLHRPVGQEERGDASFYATARELPSISGGQ